MTGVGEKKGVYIEFMKTCFDKLDVSIKLFIDKHFIDIITLFFLLQEKGNVCVSIVGEIIVPLFQEPLRLKKISLTFKKH